MIELQRWLYESATTALKGFASAPDFGALAAGLAFAVLFGFLHAMMPGHGKIALVSYYLGRPSRMLSGVVTSAILILTHVGSAIVLVLAGFAVLRHTLVGIGRAPAFEAASATSSSPSVSGYLFARCDILTAAQKRIAAPWHSRPALCHAR